MFLVLDRGDSAARHPVDRRRQCICICIAERLLHACFKARRWLDIRPEAQLLRTVLCIRAVRKVIETHLR